MTRHFALDRGWGFRRLGDSPPSQPECEVDLPHSPFTADLDGRDHWFGECEYRKAIPAPRLEPGGRCALYLGAAMHTARVFANGCEIAYHDGGYLPFEVDLTDSFAGAASCEIKIRLDNRNNPDVPPGKPFDELDFCWYGGLYRTAELRLRGPIHITDAVAANEVAGGGVFIRTLHASPERAQLNVKTHVRNSSASSRCFKVVTEFQISNRKVATATSPLVTLPGNSAVHVEQELTIENPALWSPDAPALHRASIGVVADDGVVLDSVEETFGVRRISFSRAGGFVINGERVRLRGTNRHQEFPRVGYAVPRAAHCRDARHIKEAGFDYVRLSHYPQSPDFLAACDQLGIVVMNCIPGWQYIGGKLFQDACYDAARDLIRRDRNHPCVVLWELSLNETAMNETIMASLHTIGHEEFPGDQMYTCGWIDRYDVFSHSRQHGEIHRWANGDKALVIAECGDWEFFASNEGFDQKTGAGVFDRWSTARQFRGDGERGLRQQAFNHMTALNDTLASPAVLEGQWAMFDYARGYDPVRAACGVMDVFRLPKFSYYFYQSQRDPDEAGAGWKVGPMVYIASHWTPASELRIPVFSNCDEVELRCNGSVVGRHRPARTALTQHLPHPPFVFHLPHFSPGKLEAIGYIDNHQRASHLVATPGPLAQIALTIDESGIAAFPTEPDVLIAHARLCDAHGTLCINETAEVSFYLEGSAELLGPSSLTAEAGIASIVIRVPAAARSFDLQARSGSSGVAHVATLNWQRTMVNFPATPAIVH